MATDRPTSIKSEQIKKHTLQLDDISPDSLVWQEPVIDKDLSSPPGGESEGDRYIVASTASGDWTGHENDIAQYIDGSYSFFTPIEGWFVWLKDENKLYYYTGASWSLFSPEIRTIQFGSGMVYVQSNNEIDIIINGEGRILFYYSKIIPAVNDSIDLGDSTFKFKDIYLSGNLSDGTNASSPANIKDAVDKKHDASGQFNQATTGEIAGLSEKTTPVDADVFLGEDSAASNAKKKFSWSNIKATLKTYFDTLYSTAGALFNIIEDTAPQLGGDLDMNGHNIGGNSEADIDDAVAKKHAQGTDTTLGAQSENLDMNTHKIVGVVDPTTDQEAATKKYVDDNTISEVKEDTTPELGGELDCGEHSIGFTEKANVVVANAVTIDWKVSNKQKLTVDDDVTISFTAPSNPCNLVLRIIQDGTGGHTVTLPTHHATGGTALSLTTTANAVDILAIYFDGSSYHISLFADSKQVT